MTSSESNNNNTRGVLVASSAATLGVAAVTWWWWWQTSRSRPKQQEFHVQYPHPPVHPVMKAMTWLLPTSVRRSLILKGANPKPPLDGVDVLGGQDYNPYTETVGHEIIPNKLWRVRYRFAESFELADVMKALFGVDLEDPSILDNVPEKYQSQVEQTMKERAEMKAKIQGLSKQERAKLLVQAGYEESQDMLVVRLEATGGLVLYNPCRMHAPVVHWLRELGQVEWIVSGSSSHTNQLPQAAEAFPNAKILCAQAANEKCTSVGMRCADYIYTDPESLKQAANLLKQASHDNVQLFHIQGDTLTQNLCLVAYDHLLEVDLGCYGDGHKLLVVNESDWEQPPSKYLQSGQLFYNAAMGQGACVQTGYLPNFRLMAMDHTAVLTKWLALDQPALDGSSCHDMAQSLRTLLNHTDFQYVDSAHSQRSESVPADEFKQAVNGMWKWLDGTSLLVESVSDKAKN